MPQPWFHEDLAWIPGTAFGVAAGAIGALAGWLAPRGRARGSVITAWFAVFGVAVALLLAGLVALIEGQPWGVWYGLLLPGAIGTVVMGVNSLVIVKRYRETEQRRLAARDLL